MKGNLPDILSALALSQLARFDVIEDQLGAIAQRLSEVHDMAQAAGAVEPASVAEFAPQIDVAAVH